MEIISAQNSREIQRPDITAGIILRRSPGVAKPEQPKLFACQLLSPPENDQISILRMTALGIRLIEPHCYFHLRMSRHLDHTSDVSALGQRVIEHLLRTLQIIY